MFKIGDEVVCVTEPSSQGLLIARLYGLKKAELNKVYKIEGFNGNALILKGLTRPFSNSNFKFKGYQKDAFRKLENVKLQKELAELANDQVKEKIDKPVKEEELCELERN